MITSIETCIFQRTKGGKLEHGLLLNEGDFLILDGMGKIVPMVWTWNLTPGIALHGLDIGKKVTGKTPVH